MKITILLASFFLFITNAIAQNAGKIGGIVSQNAKPAEGATVSLLRVKDSATIKLSAVNKEGVYAFENIADGKYRVSVTAVGYQRSFSNVFELSAAAQSITVPEIRLTADEKALNSVTVTAKRPLIENKIDRTVVNVEASVTNIGTSALEVLEKAPGVSVDRDGNISLKGKEGVLVMVDGRPTQLGGADLANLLRNMNSNQLDQIEIMTNPPARFDASGTSGIINIKTKKIITSGMNGSANVSYSQGRYPKTAEGFNFNYRENKINLFTNLSHNYQKRFGTLKFDRNILSDNSGSVEKIFGQEANRLMQGNAYSAKIGVDFFATQKTTIGAVVNLNSRSSSMSNRNVTNISNSSKELESITKALVTEETDWSSISTNLNFRTLLDKKGKELTSDVDFARHRMDNNLYMVNSYTNAAGNPYRKADSLKGFLPQAIDVYSARVDYLHPIKKDTRFEAGLKSSIVRTDNNAVYDSIQNGLIIRDVNRSNHFVYEENINAAYANLSTPLSKKWSAQFGLRLENTNATGVQKTTGEKFDRHYTQLFPTAYFQYKANEKNNFGFNFGRRVTRPSYQSLNPFIRFIDRYTFSQGNPSLKPSVSNNIEVSHSWKNQITTTINYTAVKDIIQEVIQQKGQEAYNMPDNVSSLKQMGLSVVTNIPVTSWWSSNVNINVFRDNYKGTIGSTPIDLAATSYIFNATQQFKITKTMTGELNGRYRSGWLEGVLRTNPVGFVGAGLSQQVLKNKGTIRLTARDIFWTQRLKGKTQYGNVDLTMSQVAETQIVTIGFTYSFSKGKKIAPVKRTAGSATEEQNRIGQ
ncbi:MAG: TonB-dependent receptor [Chitinophagaceae bacterium]|nr:MAG: TonB-dependent receptor [Chitinophagaceae bacterium]